MDEYLDTINEMNENYLREELWNENWTFMSPNYEKMYKINVFDDGNEEYKPYTNKWIIFGTWKGKVALVNYYLQDVIIKSISEWKLDELHS